MQAWGTSCDPWDVAALPAEARLLHESMAREAAARAAASPARAGKVARGGKDRGLGGPTGGPPGPQEAGLPCRRLRQETEFDHGLLLEDACPTPRVSTCEGDEALGRPQ